MVSIRLSPSLLHVERPGFPPVRAEARDPAGFWFVSSWAGSAASGPDPDARQSFRRGERSEPRRRPRAQRAHPGLTPPTWQAPHLKTPPFYLAPPLCPQVHNPRRDGCAGASRAVCNGSSFGPQGHMVFVVIRRCGLHGGGTGRHGPTPAGTSGAPTPTGVAATSGAGWRNRARDTRALSRAENKILEGKRAALAAAQGRGRISK